MHEDGRTRGRAGDEARTARSPLRLRLVLAGLGLLLWLAVGVVALVRDGPAWLLPAAAVLVVVSVVDIAVVARRVARGDTG